jgi:hypothetical protein
VVGWGATEGQTRPSKEKQLAINVRGESGFDIAGKNNVGYVATASDRRPGAELYRVDVLTGDSVRLGQVGRVGHVITGLAAVHDVS